MASTHNMHVHIDTRAHISVASAHNTHVHTDTNVYMYTHTNTSSTTTTNKVTEPSLPYVIPSLGSAEDHLYFCPVCTSVGVCSPPSSLPSIEPFPNWALWTCTYLSAVPCPISHQAQDQSLTVLCTYLICLPSTVSLSSVTVLP